MKTDHTSDTELKKRLDAAKSQIDVNAKYYHYENPDQHYHIAGIALIEETETPAVIYQSEYGENFTWIRPIDNFLAKIEQNGKMISRFSKIKQ
ncbi:DUF1653 domain-containing protein [Candidatus Saccharibacteria bacterium]|nr:DUF1653 domain-containing protein [Candidatus Saccharibacteria bacterium]MCL1963007.1 DUF1653 domain-containing protein [Candidatus Saccharibacteria bacterium]